MRKFLVITIPIVTLLMFILLMNSHQILKKPLGMGDNVPLSIQLVLTAVETEKWEEAKIRVDELEDSWSHIIKRVQFSAEKGEINGFNVSIARLRGAISTKDKSAAIIELSETFEHWDNLGK